LDQKSKEIEIKAVIWSAHTQFISLSNWP